MSLDHQQYEANAESCAACSEAREKQRPLAANGGVALESVQWTISDLELENSGLRRMVVELIEKNQQLREALRSVAK